MVSAVQGMPGIAPASTGVMRSLAKGPAFGTTTTNVRAGTIVNDIRYRPPTRMTLLAEGLTTAGTADYYYWLSTESSANNAGWGVYLDTSDNLQHVYLWVGSGFQNVSTGVGANTLAQIGFSWDGTNFRSLANGKQINNATSSGAITQGTTDMAITAYSGGAANQGDGAFYYIAIWDRDLSTAELDAFYRNPWQVLAPVVERTTAIPAGGGPVSVTPGVGNLTITGYAPTIAQPQTAAPGAGNLTLTGYAPSVVQNSIITPGVGNLTLTGYAPTVAQPQAVAPAQGTIALTGYAPSVQQPVAVLPGAGTLALTGYAPTIAQTAGQSVAPTQGNIALTGYAPTLAQTANQAITPTQGNIALTGYAPTVTQASANQAVTPDAGLITLTGYAPSIAQSGQNTGGGQDPSETPHRRPLPEQTQTIYPRRSKTAAAPAQAPIPEPISAKAAIQPAIGGKTSAIESAGELALSQLRVLELQSRQAAIAAQAAEMAQMQQAHAIALAEIEAAALMASAMRRREDEDILLLLLA